MIKNKTGGLKTCLFGIIEKEMTRVEIIDERNQMPTLPDSVYY